jgi:hypothetical protein
MSCNKTEIKTKSSSEVMDDPKTYWETKSDMNVWVKERRENRTRERQILKHRQEWTKLAK